MTRVLAHVALAVFAALFLPWPRAALAQGPAATPDTAMRQRFEALQAATVGIEARAVEGAVSAQTLGRQREGSGVVIAPQGLVLTIGYVVLEAETVQIITRDQARIPGQVVAYDFVTGLGLVRPLFPLPGVKPVPLGSAGALAKGSPLLYITGIAPRQAGAVRLVDVRPFTGYWEYHLDTALYTAPAVLNHSGAGLFNAEGELVGVGNLLLRDVLPPERDDVAPGNLFVPVDVLAPVIEDLLRTGANPQGRRPWLGVNAFEVNGRVRISRVTPGSPAQSAGVRPGQWVVAVDGRPVDSLEAFYKQVWSRGLAEGAIRLELADGRGKQELEVPIRGRSDVLARPRGI